MPTDDLKSNLDSAYTLTFTTPECGIKSVDLTNTISVDLSSLTTSSTGTTTWVCDDLRTTTGDSYPYTISTPKWYVSGWRCGTQEEEAEDSTELVLKRRRKRIKLNFSL